MSPRSSSRLWQQCTCRMKRSSGSTWLQRRILHQSSNSIGLHCIVVLRVDALSWLYTSHDSVPVQWQWNLFCVDCEYWKFIERKGNRKNNDFKVNIWINVFVINDIFLLSVLTCWLCDFIDWYVWISSGRIHACRELGNLTVKLNKLIGWRLIIRNQN